MLGTIDNSSPEKEKNTNEISNYSPPKKEEKNNKPKIFNEEKIENQKKLNLKIRRACTQT